MFDQWTADVNLTRIEEEVQRFWRRHGVPEAARAARREGPPFVLYQQPLFVAGQPPADQARLLATADLFARYRAMRGDAVHRRAGWAGHGLPVEVAVESALGRRPGWLRPGPLQRRLPPGRRRRATPSPVPGRAAGRLARPRGHLRHTGPRIGRRRVGRRFAGCGTRAGWRAGSASSRSVPAAPRPCPTPKRPATPSRPQRAPSGCNCPGTASPTPTF